MYKKEEVREIKTQFWSEFKSYMSGTRSSSGRAMNWLNYPSDIRFIYIRVDVDTTGARLYFDIQAKDEGVREIIWEQMYELKGMLEAAMGTKGQWIKDARSESVPAFNRIMWEYEGVSIFKPEDYPVIFAFLKDRLIHFDAFYQDFKDILVNLAS